MLVWGKLKFCRNMNGFIDFSGLEFICKTINYKLSEEDFNKITILENTLAEYKNMKSKSETFSYYVKEVAVKNGK
jgi:hypothetical protein